jgi:hypothetical protein
MKCFLCVLAVLATFSPSLFAQTLKQSVTWSDRRPIAAIHVASDECRSESNPAGWLFDKSIDIATEAGKSALRQRFNAWADSSIKVMKEIDAQGMIVWEIDGCRLGSYLGCPDQAEALNPEMGGLADEFFARFRAQRFKTGVCIRPVELDIKSGKLVPAPDPYASLLRRARYAHDRWGCRLFYIDTNLVAAPGVDPPQYVGLMPSAICERLNKALRGCLFIPEHEQVWGNGQVDLGYYQHTAPYMELRMAETGTPPAVRAITPGAFSVLNISEGDCTKNFDALVQAAKAGDIFLVNAWWRSPEIDPLLKIRKATGQ